MTNKYKATGTILAIMNTQEFSSNFKKREFVVDIQDGSYSQPIKFQVVQDRTELLDALETGDAVTVQFNLRGREFTRKNDGSTDYFVNLDVWRIEKTEGQVAESPEDDRGEQPTFDSDDLGDVPF